jgi:hypothetical protein
MRSPTSAVFDKARDAREDPLGAGHFSACYGFTCAVTRAIEAL